MQEPLQKGRVGPFEVWLVGKMQWEVRRNGETLAKAEHCSGCWRAAERLYNQMKAKENSNV